MSDLHLEFGDAEVNPSGEILVLAGDITVKAKQKHIDWINSLDFGHILYVFGNHEFYRGSIEKVYAKTRATAAANVHVLENETIEIEGQRFHGATLWTDFDKQNPISMMNAEGGMNDYRLIRFNDYTYRFTPEAALLKHLESVKYLKDNVKEGDVVITHMAPSFRSINPAFYTSKFNGCYASELSDFISHARPALWFHGHIHYPQDYRLGPTRVLANPRGYKDHEILADTFDWDKSVEI